MIPAIQEIGFGPGTDKAYATLHQATVSFAEMGERTISTQVRIDGDVVPNFEGWELSFKGERFILNTKDPQAVKDNSTRNSLVDLTFVSWPVNELKRYFFFEPTSIDSGTAIADKYIASVNLPVEDFVVLFNKVLNYYFGGKVVLSLYMSGQGQYSTDKALVEINYTYIWDVLVKFFEIYGVRWKIEHDSTNDVYTIKAGYPANEISDHDFEYGYKGGLVRFERQVQDVDIHNILLGRGGEKNLPYRYFKRTDPQNPDWAADPDAIPELSNIYFDRLRDINFRWYVRGWMQNPNHDTSWEEDGYTYPSYSISSDSPYYFAYEKGRTDEKFNPVEYVRDLQSIEDYGERWGALDDNDDIFPTIQGVTRDPLGRIDETVAVSEIVTDDISAMAQNAAVEKSINRMSISLYGNTRTEFEILSEEFTIPEGSTGNIEYAPFGTDDLYPGLVRFDTENSTLVAVSGSTEYPISAIPAGTYRLKLNMVIARSGQATSATGTFGIENIVLTTSSQDTDAWKPTFDIWVKNIWGTEKQEGETDVQYAERVWLPILGDRVGNEAKIVFSTGFMSVSEDYEFPIVSYPVHDTSKSINGVPSEWRITLRKSDAEFDATGLYIPNASTGGKPVAGDKFFFIGIDMPFRYVTLAEEDLNTNKSAQLDTEAAISPTWIMNLDKVRVHTLEDNEYGQTLAERLSDGTKVWITDPRFTPGRKLQLYVQSITYTWNEPSDESPYIVPDIEVVLSDKVIATESVVQRIQNDVSSIKNQYARISDVEAVVRSVAEPIFLKKTGESDSSDSPTQFSSKVTSKGFRQGGVGGTGWGIYRDNTSSYAEGEESEGETVFEADRIVVRKELQVNSLVINQISYLGGMEIISAAKIDVSKVIETENGYVCYFDQRQNSVANNFVVNDIAMGQVFNPNNTEQRYYKAIVTAVDLDSITLSKTQKVGNGVPKVGDVIVQYGNTTQSGRQYVIIRDVIGGGYERMLSGLNSLSADGDEYYFAGRESSGTGPRWFVGSHEQNGDYAEYENGVLTIKANVVFKPGQTIPGLSDLTDDVEALDYLKTALPKSDTIITGGLILSKVIALRDANNAIMSGINGDTSLSNIAAWYGGPMADKEASPTPASYAKSLFRFDGSGYLAGGNIHWDNQGYGGIPGITWSNDGTNDVVTIGANVRLASVDGDTVTDLLEAVNSIKDLFEIVNGNIHVKNNRGFYSDSFISAGGLSDGGGSAGGNATLVAQTYGGTLSATGINPINFYSKEKVNELLLTAGSVRSVAGVSPVSGDIPVASLKSALGLGAAAAYGVGSVASGNTGLVTGGSVYSAINEAVSSVLKMQGTTTTAISDGSTTNPVVIDGSSYTAKKGDVVMYGNKEFWWTGSAWEELGDEASWALKTTTISAGTGLTGGGTLASNRTISLSAASIASLALADSAYQKPSTGIPQTDLASALSTKVDHGESAYNNLNDWFEIVDGNIHVKNNRGFYSDSFISAGGLSSGGGSEGVSLAAVWTSLANETVTTPTSTTKIALAHLPYSAGTGISISSTGVISATNAGTITSVTKGTDVSGGEVTTSDGAVTIQFPTIPTSLPASDVYSWAKAETKPSYAFSELTELPTTLSGYGITDATFGTAGSDYIPITLGSTTKNVLTAHQSLAAYLTSTTAASTYATIASLNGVSERVTTLEGRTNWDTYFGIDDDGNIYVKKNGNTARGFYSYGFVSAGGVSSGGDTAGVDLTAVWNNLIANTGEGLDKKIHTAHLPAVTITGTNISGTGTYSGTGGNASTLTLNLTAVDTTYSPGTGISLSGTTFSLDVAGAKTALGLGSNAYTSTAYLPLAGGTTTGTIWRKMTADTSNYENAIGWQNAAGTSALAYIGYHNIAQTIYINAIGASDVYSDAVGKYSLVVGNNVLTYNTYPILRSDNYTTWINTTNFPGLNQTGTVTRVAMTVPTGLSVSGSPITTSGTLAISLASGYSIPTTAKQAAWDGKQDAIGDLSTIRNNAANGAAAYNALGNYVLKAGDTMTGNLTINGLSDGGNTAPLMINDAYASATWARFIQALYPNISVGGIPNLYFGKAATTRNGGVIAFYYAGSGSTSNLLTLGLHSVDHVLSVSGAGNVGIGYGTTPATYKLDVHQSGSSVGDVMRVSSEVSWANISYEATGTNRWAVGANQYGFGWWYEGLGDFAVFDTSGHLGIGTMTPHRDLDVVGVIQAGNASYNAVLESQTDGAALSFWGYGSSAWHKGYIDASTLFINSRTSGNVGIGTTAPSYKLDVNGSIGCSTLTASGNASCASLSVGSNMSVTGTGTTITGGSGSSNSRAVEVTQVSSGNWPVSMLVLTPNLPTNGTHAFMIGRTNASGNTGSLSFRYVGNASAANSFSLGFHSNDFVINAFYSGNVTIGTGNTTDYGQKLYVAGNIVATGAITAGSASDARLKTNISTLSDSDAKTLIMALRPVTYTWNDKATELYDQYKGDDLGFVAQEVEKVLPGAIGTIFDKYKRLDQTKFIAPLVAVAQDHETRIERLEKEVMARDAKIMELESEVKRLRMN